MPGIYWHEIKDILSAGITCMSAITVSNDLGTFVVKLDDYENVKRLHTVIGTAINAWERNPTGDAWALNDEDKPVSTKVHPMPPQRPLDIEKVDKYLTWVEDGMPKDVPDDAIV